MEFVRHYDFEPDGDLALCHAHGVAYQIDRENLVSYGADYFNKCAGYRNTKIANKINRGRRALVDRRWTGQLLDVGIGSGEFIDNRRKTFGTDVNQAAIEWLKKKRRYCPRLERFRAFTFWDVIEHIPNPGTVLRRIPQESLVFVSIPVFQDLKSIRNSKHYRPGEHLWYWTRAGFVDYMEGWGFRLLDDRTFETSAGRDSIRSFSFVKNYPDREGTVKIYRGMHAQKYYGHSGSVHLESMTREISALAPRSILDYGCGRSDLVAHFWLDGKRRLHRYDPAIPTLDRPPPEADLVICSDVMEHVMRSDVTWTLRHIRRVSQKALLAIYLKPARAKLPDKRNAHVTILSASEWGRWVQDVFGFSRVVELTPEYVLLATYAS